MSTERLGIGNPGWIILSPTNVAYGRHDELLHRSTRRRISFSRWSNSEPPQPRQRNC
jgi:hypothetical protein